MRRVAIVGSRNMSPYGKVVIGSLMNALRNKVEIVTIDVAGCNREIKRLGALKVFAGINYEEINERVADYADCLIVVEGGRKSGTILLASKFIEKGKEVLALPGRIDDGNSFAPNWLISQGATPLLTADFLTGDDMIEDNVTR